MHFALEVLYFGRVISSDYVEANLLYNASTFNYLSIKSTLCLDLNLKIAPVVDFRYDYHPKAYWH